MTGPRLQVTLRARKRSLSGPQGRTRSQYPHKYTLWRQRVHGEAHLAMWTQKGKASTEYRFMPTSKMRILGSGTPRLYRDLGYGLFLICR